MTPALHVGSWATGSSKVLPALAWSPARPWTASCHSCCILSLSKLELREAEPLTQGHPGTWRPCWDWDATRTTPDRGLGLSLTPLLAATQDMPVSWGTTGGGHPPHERGEGTAMSREKAELSWGPGLSLHPGFASWPLPHRSHLQAPGRCPTLRVATGGPRLALAVF